MDDEQRFEQARQRLASAVRAGFYVEDPDDGVPFDAAAVRADFMSCPYYSPLRQLCDLPGCNAWRGDDPCRLLETSHGRR